MNNYQNQYKELVLFIVILFLTFTTALAQNSIKGPRKRTVDKSLLWPNNTIRVCWEKTSANKDYSLEKSWIKDAVTNTWQKESQVHFTDWCDCNNDFEGLRIVIDDDPIGPRTKALGAQLLGVPYGMSLNVEFKNWGASLVREKIVPSRKIGIIAIAVHEFGHALGFSHQQTRDNCTLCNLDPNTARTTYNEALQENTLTKSTDNLWSTPCDPLSVMNYCNNEYFNFGVLSDYDKDALRAVYKYSKSIGTTVPLHLVHVSNVSKGYTVSEAKNGIQERQRELSQPPPLPPHHQQQKQEARIDYQVLHTNWCMVNIYLAGSDDVLNHVRQVDYSIDKSFKINQFRNTDKAHGFVTVLQCWGNFPIKATVKFDDDRQPIVLEQMIDDLPELTVIVNEYVKTPLGTRIIRKFRKQRTKGG